MNALRVSLVSLVPLFSLVALTLVVPSCGQSAGPPCEDGAQCSDEDDGDAMNAAYEEATTEATGAKEDTYDCSGVRVPDRNGFAKRVVLTFDDGPNPATTPKVIEILHKHHAPATFFNNGMRYSAAAKAIAYQIAHDPDFLLGNHTQNHINLAVQSTTTVTSEVLRTDALIKAAGSNMKYLRFPFGSASCAAKHYVEGLGYTVVGWHIDSADWCYAAGHGYCKPATFQYVDDALRNDMIGFIMQQIHQNNGGIILMHDIHQSTADHLDEILTRMENEGYTFARLDDATVLPKLNGVASKFIGEACTTNSDCTYSVNGAKGTCSAAGFCTATCTSTCPDQAGKAGTFCIANPAGPSVGMCVAKSAPQNNSCALLAHTAARTLPRFSTPSVSALVCSPN